MHRRMQQLTIIECVYGGILNKITDYNNADSHFMKCRPIFLVDVFVSSSDSPVAER